MNIAGHGGGMLHAAADEGVELGAACGKHALGARQELHSQACGIEGDCGHCGLLESDPHDVQMRP
jgi:hypothetical protein